MNSYILINILVVLLPFILSFDRRVAFFKQWRAMFPAVGLVGAFYIFEDVLATQKGNWSFVQRWTGDPWLLGLPVGEWLFFLTVPYACLFIYACVRAYIPERSFRFPRTVLWIVAGLSLTMAWTFRTQGYTVVVLSVFAFTVSALAVVGQGFLGSRHFWISMAISYAMFLIVNGILTGVPVVLYNPQAIWGYRIITIPLEDFFYNFSLLSLNMMFFRLFLRPKGERFQISLIAVPPDGFYAGSGGIGSVKHPIAPYRFLEKTRGD